MKQTRFQIQTGLFSKYLAYSIVTYNILCPQTLVY